MQVLEPLRVLVEEASNAPVAPLPATAHLVVPHANAAAVSLLLAAAFEVGGAVLADVAMLRRRVVVPAPGLAEVGSGVDGRLPRGIEALRQRRRAGIVIADAEEAKAVVAEEAGVAFVEETQVDVVAGCGHG